MGQATPDTATPTLAAQDTPYLGEVLSTTTAAATRVPLRKCAGHCTRPFQPTTILGGDIVRAVWGGKTAGPAHKHATREQHDGDSTSRYKQAVDAHGTIKTHAPKVLMQGAVVLAELDLLPRTSTQSP